MAIFDPKSLRAEEFINDEEIRETIAYAEANKHNIELINSLLEKAAPKRSGNGVTAQDSLTGKPPFCLHAISPKLPNVCTNLQTT